MVFLFIAIFVIIFLFCIPFSVGINAFFVGNVKNLQLSIKILNFIKYPRKTKKSKGKKIKNHSCFSLGINLKNIDSLRLIMIDKLFIEGNIGKINAAVFYPLFAILNSIPYVKDRIRMAITDDSATYFQLRFFIKLNFHIIFSIIFQIIKIEFRR